MSKGRISVYLEREMKVLDYLQRNNIATTNEISEYLSASPATVRRDITEMSEKGLILKFRGYVQLAPKPEQPSFFRNLTIVSDIDQEKSNIAKLASSLVKDGDCIFIGAGKTCNFFANYIRSIKHLTVVTTSITVAVDLIACSNISIILLGGDVRPGINFIETIPPDSEIEKNFEFFYFDKVFITVDGIELDRGYTIKNRMQIPMYTKLRSNTSDFYVLADSDKFDRLAFAAVFGIDEIDNIVTTEKTPAVYLDHYRERGKALYLAHD